MSKPKTSTEAQIDTPMDASSCEISAHVPAPFSTFLVTTKEAFREIALARYEILQAIIDAGHPSKLRPPLLNGRVRQPLFTNEDDSRTHLQC